jgi:membrane-bound lytic murein transglycosylase C
MQIIPESAGKDVYSRIKHRDDQPTRSVLFRPEQNIDIGAAYLHILEDIYFRKLTNPQSRAYSTISAYNGGAGNVFKTFSHNRDRAPAVINSLTAQVVYKKLTQEHPRGETRRYLPKVLKFRENYW